MHSCIVVFEIFEITAIVQATIVHSTCDKKQKFTASSGGARKEQSILSLNAEDGASRCNNGSKESSDVFKSEGEGTGDTSVGTTGR